MEWFDKLTIKEKIRIAKGHYPKAKYLHIEFGDPPDYHESHFKFLLVDKQLLIRFYNYDYAYYATIDIESAMNTSLKRWNILFRKTIMFINTLDFDKKGIASHIKRITARLNVSSVCNDEAALLFNEYLLLLVKKQIIPKMFIL